MITPNHGLSGYLCGQVAMPLLRRHSPLSERAMGWAFFLGAMLPDGDILSRVLVGRGAYVSGHWYSHRGLSHSLLGTLLLGLLLAALLYRPLARQGAGRADVRFAWLAACGWAGGLLHIFGDLFTPGWQMPVFWPLEARYGAWRHIGWFSPYLLALFLSAALLGTLAARGLARTPALRRWAPWAAWGVYTLAVGRWVGYLVRSRYESWDQWVAYQQDLLPDALIVPLTQGVSMVWRWFTG